MKKLKISMLALAVFAGGILASSAASSIDTGRSVLSIAYSNNATLYSVFGVAVPDGQSNIVFTHTSVDTDAAGKISGITGMGVNILNGTNKVAESRLISTLNGSIKGQKSGLPTVQLNLKGNGFSFDGTTGAKSTLTMNFKGTVTVVSNNVTAKGTITGNFNSGLPGTKSEKISGNATITDMDGSDFGLFTELVQQGTKYFASGFVGGGGGGVLSGTGNTDKNGGFKMKYTGLGSAKGASVQLAGTTTVSTNVIILVGTNATKVTIAIPGTITSTSVKAIGQTITPSGAVITKIEGDY